MAKKKLVSKKKQAWAKKFKFDNSMRGKPLRYNVAVQKRYQKDLDNLFSLIIKETEKEVHKLYKTPEAKEYFAEEIMPKKAKLEIWYVDNWNIILDLELFCRTIFKLSKTFARYSVDRFVGRKR